MVKILIKPQDQIAKLSDPLESKIESNVVKYARKLGFYARKFVSTSNRSVPDDLFISKNGDIFFIEFKRLGKTPTVAQEYEHELIRANGGKVYVIDNIRDGRRIIDGYC